ncbi:MAG TPA: biotin--[acetyl-CoA-carboxylase] ligase [Xanthobacteraceae bacterium]|nr:biotin--[acetyl-CoA-carboxylase] ligase [Xanthobacteraceae bacterium]
MQLDPSAAAAGFELIIHDTIGSTNSEACALARAGARGPLWIIARAQTAGRGRRGNSWISEPGNLYASLLLSDVPPGRAGELAFVAALAVHDSVSELAPNMTSRLALKWPNDVQLGNAKFAGILVEAENPWAVIGIGINCAHHPAQMPNVTDLKSSGIAVSLEQLLAALSKHMLLRLQQWETGKGFAAIRQDWLDACPGVGHPILVRLPAQELTGKFENIDHNGHLMLRLRDGRIETVAAGEVFGLEHGGQAQAAR